MKYINEIKETNTPLIGVTTDELTNQDILPIKYEAFGIMLTLKKTHNYGPSSLAFPLLNLRNFTANFAACSIDNEVHLVPQ